MQNDPNPQGKGISPVLQGLAQNRPAFPLPPKQIDQVSGELFTSLFVLNSDFSFRPVAGRSYWLYRMDGKFKLLLLSPGDWSAGHPGQFIAECILQEDVTWTLTLDAEASRDACLRQYIDNERQRLQADLEKAGSLEEAMPDYMPSLTFYRRLLAFGLGSSLRASLRAAGINALTWNEAKGLLAKAAI
jgi:hypothetical protein